MVNISRITADRNTEEGRVRIAPLLLTGSYDYRLVALSVAFAMLAAYAALDLAGRVTVSHGWPKALWLAGGATAMGVGIWAMHYIGMLALTLPVPVLYHYPTVVLSLLVAIAASAVALFTVSRERMGVKQEIAGSVVMGSGIAEMHYIGMAAMRLPAMMDYRWGLVVLSVVLAIVISLVALILTFHVRQEQRTSLRKVASAMVMGSAIPLMHYTGMWAVQFHFSAIAPDPGNAISISWLGIAAISATSFAVLAGAIATSVLGRLLGAQRAVVEASRKDELYFRTLAEALPEMIWTANPDGTDDFFSGKWFEYTGLTLEQSLGSGWTVVIHPDDVAPCLAKWKIALRSGEPYQVEYRFRRAADGVYRWFLGRANPIRDAKGEIIKWFGTCTDIEDQKQNQQILEEQIRERTVELNSANTRLQEEMCSKDLARHELDRQNEKMLREVMERSKRATMLAKMGELLQSCVSKDEVFAAAMGFAPKIFSAGRGALALLNSERTLAEVIGWWAECQLPSAVFEPSSCWALRTGHPHLVLAGDSTARCPHADGVKSTYLCVPILAQGEALGIVHFQATEDSPAFADSELSHKTTFAGQVGLSIANIRLREALRSQSVKDPLTGLYNRRYLEETLERELRRAVRAEQSLGILMLDLDHFKKINDTYGHEAGDTVLRDTADFLTKSVRVEDTVCRIGGEEFVIVLPTANAEAGRARAERIRSKLRELTILHQGQSVGRITVSIGVAELPVNGTTAKNLLEAADAALYRAKRDGRDRVVIAESLAASELAAAALAGEASKS
jgi:diguanylate cyclase (GGDEF)-like protein/PAS domain S-box-containing protein